MKEDICKIIPPGQEGEMLTQQQAGIRAIFKAFGDLLGRTTGCLFFSIIKYSQATNLSPESDICSSEGDICSSEGDICSSEDDTCSSEGDICSSEGDICSSEGDICSSEDDTCSSEGDIIS